MYPPDRAADHFSERDAVRHGPSPRDDIGVVHPVAVAVEGAVVDYDGAVTHQGVSACRGVEKQPDVARVSLQAVSDKGVPARKLCEYSARPSAGHDVRAKGEIGVA